MASDLENLQTAYTNVCTKLADVTASPKPSYSVDGKSVSWGEHYKQLTTLRDDLKKAIVNEEGPFESRISGWT